MSYQQSKIRQLLRHFSPEQLCIMVYDEPLGRPLYERLRPGTLGQLPQWLLADSRYYAPLLQWVKRNHPTRYRQYAPYAENPFHVGSGYLHAEADFYGRQRLLREVKGALQKQNVAILSPRPRMGSSSFLYHLVATKATWLPASTLLAYIDLYGVLDDQNFFATVADKLSPLYSPLNQGGNRG